MIIRKFCPYCMSPLQEGELCPVCGLTKGSYEPAPHHLPPGTVLADHYLIGRVLGEGGFGITYIGCDLRLEMKVAIKEYFPTERVTRTASSSLEVVSFAGASTTAYQQSKEKFIQEARAMARLVKQPVIVGVRDYFEDNNTAYIVMEYIEGVTLKELVEQRGGCIPAEELLHLIEPVFGALLAVHKAGLIHRDISPDNLMLEKGNIRLLDFGCARENVADAKTLTITLKYGYAPIEQYQGKRQGPWTDVYALAATIYYCLTGKLPPQSMDRLMGEELIPPRKLGVDLTEQQERALLHAMEVRPGRRFQSMQEFHAALYEEWEWWKQPESTETTGATEEIPGGTGTISGSKPGPTEKIEPTGEKSGGTKTASGQKPGPTEKINPTGENSGGTKTASGPRPEPTEPVKESTGSKKASSAWLPWAAMAAVLVMIVAVALLRTKGAPSPEGETTVAVSSTEEDQAAQLRQEMDELFADAQTCNNNWEDFVAMLNDDSVSAVIIPEGTALTTFSRVSITKPVLVEESAYLGAWDMLTLDGEDACIYVKGELSPTSVLRTINGGRIVVDESGDIGASAGAFWLEDEEDLTILGGKTIFQDDQLVICSENELRSQSTEVATAEEFTAALNNSAVKAIMVTGDIIYDANGEDHLYVPVPLIIDGGATLSITNTNNGNNWVGHMYLGSDSCLINYGTLNAFVNTGNALPLVNEYGAEWTGGTFNTSAIMINLGDITITQENSCVKGSDPYIGGTLGETGHFYNEGTLTVEQNDFYVGDGIFCNTNSGTIVVNAYFALCDGVSATNYGTIQINRGGAFDNGADLLNYGGGRIEVAPGGRMDNEGVLLNWDGSVFQASGELANNALILSSETADFACANRPGGRVETIASLESTPGSNWATASTAEELTAAMNDASVQGVLLKMTEDVVLEGDLTVTKPLILKNWSLRVQGAVTVEDGYIAGYDSMLVCAELVLEDNTFAFLGTLSTANVSVEENASLYYAYHSYSTYEGEWWYGESIGAGGQINVDGGTVTLLTPFRLHDAAIYVSNGGTLQSVGYTIFENCTVDIAQDSYLKLGAYRFDENTLVTNNGYVQMSTSCPVDYRMEGNFVNNGAMLAFSMDVYGSLENNGRIYYSGDNSSWGIVTKSGGEIRGNEILTYTNGMDWMKG